MSILTDVFSYRSLLVLILTLGCIISPAQHNSEKDSLKTLLATTAKGKQRVDILNHLAYSYFDFDDSLAFVYARQSVKEAENIEYPIGLQYAYTMLGIGHFSYGEYETALVAFRKAEALNTKGTLQHSVYNLMLKGNVLSDIGEYDSAEHQYNKAIALLKQAHTEDYLGGLYKAFARLYYSMHRNEEALRYLKLAEEKRVNEKEVDKIDLYTLFPRIYLQLNKIEKAQEINTKLCTLVAPLEDNFHKAMCLLIQAEIYYNQGTLTDALEECFKALELSDVYDYHLLRAQLFLQIGEVYLELSDYKLASDFLYKALAITEKSNMRPLSAELYVTLAWMYKDQGNYELALEFTEKAQVLWQMMKVNHGIARCHNVRGLLFLLQKKYDQSIEEHTKALELRRQVNNREGISASLFNMSLAYEESNLLEKALELQLKALAIDIELPNKQSLAISYNGLSQLYVKLNRLEDAEECLLKVEALALETKSQALLKNYFSNYADLMDAKGDFKRASYFRKKQQRLTDSLNRVNNNMKLAEMQAIYQVDKREQEIALLSKERELQLSQMEWQESKIQSQRLIIMAGSLAFILALIFIYFIVKANKKVSKAKIELAELNEELMTQSEELRESNQSLTDLNNKLVEQQEEIQAQTEELQESNTSLAQLNKDIQEKQEELEAQAEELREANETILIINTELEKKIDERTSQLRQAYIELDTFFYRSSHDFRRPITTFLGLAEVANITVSDTKALDLFEKVKETAQSLDKMIRKLQSISDVGAQEFVYKEVLLRELIDNILVGFKDEIAKKNIKVTQDIKVIQTFQSYAALVQVIIENLLENSIQFSSPPEPFVKIKAQTKDHTLELIVEDNGQGIAEEYHDRIFDMYFRANVSSKGNGLGLYILKKAVTRLNGSIEFSTKVHSGSVFKVILPLNG